MSIRINLAWLLVLYFCGNFMACTSPEGTSIQVTEEKPIMPRLQIAENQRYFVTEDGDPFFWLGDTGWLLFGKLDRSEGEQYLDDRREKGFNVIQVMMLHSVGVANAYGDSALVNQDVAQPMVKAGNDPEDPASYDYWDHMEYLIKTAREKGLYMALVPIWGSNVRAGKVSVEQARTYTQYITERFGKYENIIWLNGGDVPGSDSTAVWNAIGQELRARNPNHLITFHPRGRTQSSDWFHEEEWLDFHMFQSGHRRYDQDDTEKNFGEDNWRYVEVDMALEPLKPTLDGEPSYEGIPQGLHDPEEPFWNEDDVRRYGYWSVLAGAAGYTYGHSALMQMYKETDDHSAYGNTTYWNEALDAPGAHQMVHLKELILDYPFFDRVPDQSLIANQGERYDYLVASRGKDYVLIYTYTGRPIQVKMGAIEGEKVKARWFNPRNGEYTDIGEFENEGTLEFSPNGNVQEGNDWVLVLN
ncbi:glycoside hydrolase family 140 protein [Pleomorphovibrio marinus]|uniref:glycoside hydrolase family 140 protein n=1 Tax=Pleomorphovibrio marinus TaxID=2164132 RepID=UPI000E09EDD5|nr:glycoside hydrolase family 140 protein [Pleomorphovibrio marinus]